MLFRSAGLHIEEDQETDSERSHTTETMAFIAFDGAFSYSDSGKKSIAITADEVKITNLVFTNLTGLSTRENIRIEMTAEFNNPGKEPEYDYSQSWRTAVSVRQ